MISIQTAVRESAWFVHLDMLRGLAALGVVLGHTRGFVLVDYKQSESGGLLTALLYGTTGIGHLCVIIFFALSGFLVGGSVIRQVHESRWHWVDYIIRRLARLWTVAVPALLLTALLDNAGIWLAGASGYDGQWYGLLASGPNLQQPADLSVATFFANVFFLQTIVTPVFGVNGPLWSLANEFWYYVVFPLFFLALLGRRSVAKRLSLAVAGAIVTAFLPFDMLVLGSIWVAGAIGASYRRSLSYGASIPYSLAVLIAVAAAARYCLWRPGLISDVIFGLAVSALIPRLAVLPSFGGGYALSAAFLSKISYTLYATHFPIIALLWFTILAPQQLQPGLISILVMIGVVAFVVAIASLMWWCFERNTDRVRTFVMRFI